MELLQLTRAGDCEQSGNGALALGTPIAEHDLPPLHGRPEGSFGHVVGGCDRLFMHEGEEVGVMHEQRAWFDTDVRGIDVAFCQRNKHFSIASTNCARVSGACAGLPHSCRCSVGPHAGPRIGMGRYVRYVDLAQALPRRQVEVAHKGWGDECPERCRGRR